MLAASMPISKSGPFQMPRGLNKSSRPKPKSSVVPSEQGVLQVLPRRGWSSSNKLLKAMTGDYQGPDMRRLAQDIASTQETDGGWKEDPTASASDLNSAVVNHVALATFLRRAEHAKHFPKHHSPESQEQYTLDDATRSQLEDSLAQSWKNLTKKVPEKQHKFLGALPTKVTSKLKHSSHAIHRVLLSDDLEVRLEPDKHLEQALSLVDDGAAGLELAEQPKQGFDIKDLAVKLGSGLALAGACLAAPAMVAGAAYGWIAASLHEAFIHEKITHIRDLNGPRVVDGKEQPRSFLGKLADRFPIVKKAVKNAHFYHSTLHHYTTYKEDNVTQFRSEKERDKMDAWLKKMGREDLIESEYGSGMSWGGFARFQAVALPGYAAQLGAIAGIGLMAGIAPLGVTGGLFLAGFAAPTALYPLLTKSYHRYIHMPVDKIKEVAPKAIQKFMQTKMSRHVVRHHMVHHDDDTKNFNLMPGADFILGAAQKATVAQEEEFRRTKVLW